VTHADRTAKRQIVAGRIPRIYTGNKGNSRSPAPFSTPDHALFMNHQNLRHPILRALFGRHSLRVRALLAVLIVTLPGVTANAQGTTAPGRRPLAPGILTTIPPSFEPSDTVSTHDLVEIRANQQLKWKPEFLAESDTLFGLASNIKFRREVWCLEFSFKPLRMVELNVDGQSKLVWYLVYRVRNTGQVLKPVEGEGGVYSTTFAKGGPVRFLPKFILESNDRTADGKRVGKGYLDRI
jgi:hypothetical protein